MKRAFLLVPKMSRKANSSPIHNLLLLLLLRTTGIRLIILVSTEPTASVTVTRVTVTRVTVTRVTTTRVTTTRVTTTASVITTASVAATRVTTTASVTVTTPLPTPSASTRAEKEAKVESCTTCSPKKRSLRLF